MADIVKPIFLICLGFLPSLVWLWLFLHEEVHPEPKKLLTQTFLLAILLAPLAVLLQSGYASVIGNHIAGFDYRTSSSFFFWSAFVEEAVKYAAVYYIIVHRPEFDAPVDAMIYMVTAGLGFAAIENTLGVLGNISNGWGFTLGILAQRAVGATLLHALASGLVGYFLALSWFHYRHSRTIVWLGLAMATLFHFAFNLTLLKFEGHQARNAVLGLLLVVSLFLILVLFAKLKQRSGTNLSTRFEKAKG